MALRYHWLLKDNLNDSCSEGLTLTGTNITKSDMGKLGNCYDFGESGFVQVQSNNLINLLNSGTFSISFWVKPKSIVDNVYYGLVSCGSAGTNRLLHIIIRKTGFITFAFYGNDLDSDYIPEPNKWIHVTCTYGNNTQKIYVDGVLRGSRQNVTNIEIMQNHDFYIGNYSNNKSNSCFNDFRIYDHELTKKEIKLLSQCKIMHYDFNSFSTGLTNTLDSSSLAKYNNFGTGDKTTASIKKTNLTYMGCNIYRLEYTVHDTTTLNHVKTTFHGHGVYTVGVTFKANTKYSASILYKPISHTDIIVGGTASNIGGFIEIPNVHQSEGWIVATQKRDGSVTADKRDCIFFSFICPSAELNERIVIDFCCPTLFEGTDELQLYNHYLDMNNVVTDCGIIQNHFELSSNNAYYSSTEFANGSGSMRFNGPNTNSITISTDPFKLDNYTVSLWFKKLSNSHYRGVFELGLNNNPGEFVLRLMGFEQGKIRFHPSGLQGNQPYIEFPYTVNKWHHVVMTVDGLNSALYVDGVKIGTATSNYLISRLAPNKIRLGENISTAVNESRIFDGYIDDVQIYGTTFSDEDVIALYTNKLSISKDGQIYTGELIETQDSSIDTSNGELLEVWSAGWGGTSKITFKNTTHACYRGVNVLVISNDLKSSEFQKFDTYGGDSTKLDAFKDLINNVDNDSYISIVWYDHTGGTYGLDARNFIKSVFTRSDIDSYDFIGRDAYVLIAQKNGNIIFEGFDKEIVDGDPVYVKKKVYLNNKIKVQKSYGLITSEIDEVGGGGLVNFRLTNGTIIPLYTEERNGQIWARIFYHYNRAGTVLFSNFDEATLCNINTPLTVDKYSIIGFCDEFIDSQGYYEFLLTYPKDTEEYNQWKQTNVPNSTSMSGYSMIHQGLPNAGDGGFSGIMKSSTPNNTAYDCNTKSNHWYFAIGAHVKYSSGIPHYDSTGTPNIVELWVKLDYSKIGNRINVSFTEDGKALALEFNEI